MRNGETIPESSNSDKTSQEVFFLRPGVPGASAKRSPLRISRLSAPRTALVAALPRGGTPGPYPSAEMSHPNVTATSRQS